MTSETRPRSRSHLKRSLLLVASYVLIMLVVAGAYAS